MYIIRNSQLDVNYDSRTAIQMSRNRPVDFAYFECSNTHFKHSNARLLFAAMWQRQWFTSSKRRLFPLGVSHITTFRSLKIVHLYVFWLWRKKLLAQVGKHWPALYLLWIEMFRDLLFESYDPVGFEWVACWFIAMEWEHVTPL